MLNCTFFIRTSTLNKAFALFLTFLGLNPGNLKILKNLKILFLTCSQFPPYQKTCIIVSLPSQYTFFYKNKPYKKIMLKIHES